VGQVQLDHGRGPWNEWCLAFDDGSWGWLAEAQGELLFTRPSPPLPYPRHDALRPGEPVDLGAAGHFVVGEVGRATVTAVKGELPIRVRPGELRLYADLRSGEKGFATLDYGDDTKCDGAFVGRVVDPAEAGLDPSRAPAASVRFVPAERLNCPKCGGEIRIRDPATVVRLGCSHCGALLDPAHPGAAVATARFQVTPSIPLGSRGKLRGLDVEVLAFLVRSVSVDGMRYAWREYLLRAVGGKGYRWLSESNGHWMLLEPVGVGSLEIRDGSWVKRNGERFRHFQGGTAVLDAVYGEVYWRAEIGEKVQSDDYVAPPRLVSVEGDAKEIQATLGEYLERDELAAAFALKSELPWPSGIAPAQPNHFKKGMGLWWGLCLGVAVVDLLMTLYFSATGAEHFGLPCCMDLPVLLAPALYVSTRSGSFETQRWEESDHPPMGQ
jgi:hypothetical protein